MKLFSRFSRTRQTRRGFTLIELLVVIAIIAVLVALLLPAIQKAREAAARAQCSNNMRQMGIALHTFHDSNKCFPSSGELQSDNLNQSVATTKTTFAIQSTFTLLLPYIEQSAVYDQIDLTSYYLNQAAPFKQAINTYLCPTNPVRPKSGVDSAGFGYVDYMTIAYISVDTTGVPGTVVRNDAAGTRCAGALALKNVGGYYGLTVGASAAGGSEPNTASPGTVAGGNISGYFVLNGNGDETTRPNRRAIGMDGPAQNEILDGLSHTIVIAEDVGRSEQFYTPNYGAPIADPTNTGAPGFRAGWRWGEPDSGNGISGPSKAGAGANGSTPFTQYGDKNQKPINNYKKPFGGDPTNCPWTKNNCGPNDEVFSFHNAGANCLFADGHVTFISDDIDLLTFRRLCTPNEGINANYSE